MSDNVANEKEQKVKRMFDEVYSELPQFGNDLLSFCRFIKEKHGFWITASYQENGKISIMLPEETIATILS